MLKMSQCKKVQCEFCPRILPQLWGTLECVGSGPAFSMELLCLVYPKHTRGYKSRCGTSGCTLHNRLEGRVPIVSLSTITTCMLPMHSRESFSVSFFVPSPKLLVLFCFFSRFLWSVTFFLKKRKAKKKQEKRKKKLFLYQGKTEFSPDVYAKRTLSVIIVIMKVDIANNIHQFLYSHAFGNTGINNCLQRQSCPGQCYPSAKSVIFKNHEMWTPAYLLLFTP